MTMRVTWLDSAAQPHERLLLDADMLQAQCFCRALLRVGATEVELSTNWDYWRGGYQPTYRIIKSLTTKESA